MTELCRRLCNQSPPCCIFALSLALLAFGILFLKPKIYDVECLRVCFTGNFRAPNNKILDDFVNISTTVQLTLSERDIRTLVDVRQNRTMQFDIMLREFDLDLVAERTLNLFDDPLADLETSDLEWPTSVSFTTDSIKCDKTDEDCSVIACAIIFAKSPIALPRLPIETSCVQSFDIVNKINAVTTVSEKRATLCVASADLRLDDAQRFAMRTLQRNISMAHIHLLYTSCFLFSFLALLLFISICSNRIRLSDQVKYDRVIP